MINEKEADELAIKIAEKLYPCIDDNKNWSARQRFLAGIGQLIGAIYE